MYGILYLPTFLVDFYGFRVGKYTVRPMDPLGRHRVFAFHPKILDPQPATL